ncbi:MAG: hypothetical protein ABIN97_17895 [Ginsengibacter sp.]
MKQYYQKMILLVLWIIIQGFLLWQNGVVTTEEAEKYISEAEYFLKTGNFSRNSFWLYSTQIFLIAATIKLQLSYTVVIIVQLLLNLYATLMFFKLAQFFLKNSILSFLVTFFFIINIPYQAYNSFLFTESIFYSLTVIYSSFLLRLNKLTINNLIIIIVFLALISITRPTGILFFGATAFYIFFRFLSNINLWKKLAIICSALIIFFATLNSMLQIGGSLNFMISFKMEYIVCGVNTTSENVEIKTLENGNSLRGILYYFFNNGKQFFRLSILKTISFFGLVRNYYSPFHNILLVIFFYPFYLLSLVGAWKMFRRKEQTFFYMAAIIVLFWITVLLTCDDWHNRFVLPILPFIFLMGLSVFKKADSIKERT